MPKYLCLLRGINVGGNNKIEMYRLKTTFKNLGFNSVQTYINSGNVIFESKDLDINILNLKIQQAIKSDFGLEIKTLIRSSQNISELCEQIPAKFINDSEQKTDILFLWEDFDNQESLNLIKTNQEVDSLLYFKGCIVWNVQKSDYSKSGMNKFIGTKIYKNMTARNVNTVRKLGEMLGG